MLENYSKCRIWAFSTHFGPHEGDLSGNTVWPKVSGFQKLLKLTTFVHSKCKRSSLRSQCWMRLFLWFSNTVVKAAFRSSATAVHFLKVVLHHSKKGCCSLLLSYSQPKWSVQKRKSFVKTLYYLAAKHHFCIVQGVQVSKEKIEERFGKPTE